MLSGVSNYRLDLISYFGNASGLGHVPMFSLYHGDVAQFETLDDAIAAYPDKLLLPATVELFICTAVAVHSLPVAAYYFGFDAHILQRAKDEYVPRHVLAIHWTSPKQL